MSEYYIPIFLDWHASLQVQVNWFHKLFQIALGNHIFYDGLVEVLDEVPDLLEPALQEGNELVLCIVQIFEKWFSWVFCEIFAHGRLIVLS